MLFDPTKLTGPHAERVAELVQFDPLFQKLPTQLFTFDNGKTPKGEKQGYLTAIMYLAPARLSGYQMCPFAHLAQCEEPCLNTAGRGKFDSTQKARIRKTLMSPILTTTMTPNWNIDYGALLNLWLSY